MKVKYCQLGQVRTVEEILYCRNNSCDYFRSGVVNKEEVNILIKYGEDTKENINIERLYEMVLDDYKA